MKDARKRVVEIQSSLRERMIDLEKACRLQPVFHD